MRVLVSFFVIVPWLVFVCSAAEPDYPRLARVVIQVESRGRVDLVGDHGKAHGPGQTHKIMVDEVNRILGAPCFRYEDRTDPRETAAMIVIFLRAQHAKHPHETRAQLMARWRNPNGNAPRWHLAKVRKAMEAT